MITLTQGTADNIVEAEAAGKVTAQDYDEVLLPAVDAASEGGRRARLLYVLGADFDGYEAEAAMDDARMGLHHWSDFDKIALVTDHEGYRVMERALGFLMPGEVKVFTLDERDEARAWVEA